MLYTVDGLVLRARDYGENDRLITILTNDGKMTVIAKGARSMKSKTKNLTEPFVYANFELNQKGTSIAWIKGGSINQSFYDLRNSIEKLFLATYVCDVANELSGERVDCSDMLRLTLNTLFAIMSQMRPLSQIKAVFEIRASAMSGYRPNVDYCEHCETEKTDNTYFDVMNGAIICSECLQKRGEIHKRNLSLTYDDIRENNVLLPLNPASLAAIRYALHSPTEKMLSFSLSEAEDVKMFSKACEDYLLHHLGHGFESLDLYYSIL
jgi:DNA repair protein RecO (recombination protein O)